MSEYERRSAAAEAELDAAGVWKSNAVPPIVLFKRKIGMKPTLPYYEPFWRSFLKNAVFYSVIIGLASSGRVFDAGWGDITSHLTRTCFIGFGLGLLMTSYIYYQRAKHGLSAWGDL